MLFGIFVYDGVEPIDLATFGVLSMARRIAPHIRICTIAPKAGIVQMSNGLDVVAQFGIEDAPVCDVVIVTGGPGWEHQSRSAATLEYIRRVHASNSVASVCTGAMILAASGVLDNTAATTKRAVVPPEISPLERMRDMYPRVDVCEAPVVDAGAVVTGGGVSLCIDTTLHILEKMLGETVAGETARLLEYQRARQANRNSEAFLAGQITTQRSTNGETMTAKTLVSTDKAAPAAGPYSQATRTEQFVFASGQLPIDPVSGNIPDGIESQTRQSLANLSAVLEAGGASFATVLKTTVFLKNMSDFAVMNGIYAGFFSDAPPARSTIEVARLPKDALVEVEAIALRTKG